ncbi:endonuclease MutS2 [Lactobacillus jensenii]|jgi:mutS2 protein|uniref:Endonuclease MutS2 n=2 Tax=Lactobacillus jensenii TaxID=109790 RepID=A0A5N1ID09_LACJE|nr:endonuclease MutS2 [Lactobacillus jensenii]ERJ41758.1 DNA mismatch repair protein MutS [Lactobacillus jensenii MD IIE-70(2)]APT15144.1 endonuclease MutS2 [Lactobacillus jensenii]EEQ24099.1 MutS2 family protein [Lactobacillus jensenii 269-3]EEX26801.1 MutS2 family protein [Lactobacillus jensenii SJ-7A-US]KAA9235895.1 endonuclease MutS2 [Lactobacillus jensenii]
MNHKILKILEYPRITEKLAQEAVTDTAKKQAQDLQPSDNSAQVRLMLSQTRAVANLLRIRGQLPIVNFKPLEGSLKRLKVKASLNAEELANILLILTLAKEINDFIEKNEDAELDLSAIDKILQDLQLPAELLSELKHSIDFDGSVLDSASTELARLRHDLAANEEEIKNKMTALTKSASKYLSEGLVTIRDDRYVLPVKQEFKGKLGGVVHDQSASGQTLFVEPEAVLNLNNRQQSLLAQERKEIRKILKHLSALAGEDTECLRKISDALTELDFLQAKAKLAKKMKATQPQISDNHEVLLRQARHPLIDPEKVVPNDISLGIDFDTMLITGPNTGGKTITLKTLGLIQLMAQSGLFIPTSENSQVGVFDEIYADIGDEQSIEQSLSTFSSHMNDIIYIMKHVNKNTLVLIDEIGAGTDPEEGASLAIAILDELREHGAKIMVTTHYPELKLYGYNRDRTTNASMEFDVKNLTPTYILQVGIPGYSNAFAITRRLGMNEKVVKKAESLTKDSDSELNKMIARLNEQTKEVTAKRKFLAKNLEKSEELLKKLQDGLDIYNQRVQRQLEFANERANEVVAKKRKKAEAIIAELEKQKASGAAIKENKLIDAKGDFNKLSKEADNLAHNKVLRREKKRHNVAVGDQVKVLSYGQVGTVTKKLSDHDYEVQMGIVKLKVTDRDIEKEANKALKKKQTIVRTTRKLNRASASSQLDLRGQRYEEAMVNLDRYMDASLLAGLSSVVIVHGIGTGAIRQGVWQYLKSSRHVKSFNYAPANEGGNGATIVELK